MHCLAANSRLSQKSWPKFAKVRFIQAGADVPSMRRETGCFLWVIQQSKVVGCCAGVQALTVRRCFVVAPVDMLAVEVSNIQAGVWERRDGRWCKSRAWRIVDVNDLISCYVYAVPSPRGALVGLASPNKALSPLKSKYETL